MGLAYHKSARVERGTFRVPVRANPTCGCRLVLLSQQLLVCVSGDDLLSVAHLASCLQVIDAHACMCAYACVTYAYADVHVRACMCVHAPLSERKIDRWHTVEGLYTV